MLRSLPVFAFLSVGLLGCAGIGPTRLSSDQLQYARAISEAQKRQTLLNIVLLRYGNAPTLLPVNQVVSSYTLEQGVELGLNVYPNAHGGNYATGLGTLNFSDRPTVTFAPLSGEQLARMVRPLSPADLLPVAQGALPIDVLFRLAVQSMGPLENTVVLGGEEGAGDPEFFELLAGMRRLQVRGLLTVRFVSSKDGNHVFLGIADGSDPDTRAIAARTRAAGRRPSMRWAQVRQQSNGSDARWRRRREADRVCIGSAQIPPADPRATHPTPKKSPRRLRVHQATAPVDPVT